MAMCSVQIEQQSNTPSALPPHDNTHQDELHQVQYYVILLQRGFFTRLFSKVKHAMDKRS